MVSCLNAATPARNGSVTNWAAEELACTGQSLMKTSR